ncbi:ABC transporter substrate-binding protein [Treponema primitia]|uniref:ABC transporter substrate-binding protein n=1 Tax=Treponema primitia TaxID=88058 RepID=UPI0002554FDC|nr:extracellular solute-binding protein [Treponema primitia]
MNVVKKVLFTALVLVITAGTVSMLSCQKKDAVAGKGPYQLTFWTFQDLHRGFMEDAAEVWNAKNPDRQIKLNTEVYSYDDNHNKLLIALQSGKNAPDIADIEIARFANFIQGTSPGLLPLNDVLAPYMEYVVKARFDNYAKNGNYYGVDAHVGATVMYYNMDIMNAAGIDINAIKTWDDFVAAGRTVLAKTGKPMTAYETTEHWSMYPLMNQQGSDIFAADGSVILDNAINNKTLQFMLDNIRSGIAVKAPGGFMHSEEWYAYMNEGNVGAIVMPAWYMGRFTDYMPDLKGKIAILPMPVFNSTDKRSAGMGGTGTGVTNQAKDAALCKDFLAFAKLDRDQSIKTWTVLGFDPLRWDVWDDPIMKAPNKYTDYFGTGVFDILYTVKDEFNPLNITANYPQGITVLQKSVLPAALESESLTPAAALKAGADELRAIN